MEVIQPVSVIATHQPELLDVAPNTTLDAPIPLSFPSILRNPGIKDKYAYLYDAKPRNSPARTYKKAKRDDNEGKRWVRRKENARFSDNPYISLPTRRDYTLHLTEPKTTFPEPLPSYLHRNTKIPATSKPLTDPASANAGRFSFSIKGMRRDLRRAGYRAEHLVQQVETEILEWLDAGGVTLNPDLADSIEYSESAGHPVADTGSIFEISRTPQQLVWSIPNDPFARYVVHCCARFHSVVSFSKEVAGTRLTYLLRPNVTRPDFHAAASLDTPPMTDLDASSRFDSDTDIGSSVFADSDDESIVSQSGITPSHRDLSDIDELARSGEMISTEPDTDAWSVIGESDADGEQSEAEHPLTSPFRSLSLREGSHEPDRTLEAVSPSLRQTTSSNRWQSQHSSSSPSRSPDRVVPRRLFRATPPMVKETKTLYAYLYS
ncbi:hypothetical protein C8R42DRAFT_662909 [Lentinula raphanica]|nr:hypothetical protein C8R42DRAFT_662909 [Lentinula raphanica]